MSDVPEIKNKTKTSTKKNTKSTPEKELKKKNEAKKFTTKMMVHQALTDLKARKGTSLQAIKKYIQKNYDVDVVRNNYIIKKVIKVELEAGTVVHTSGTGASGSFKLTAVNKTNEKKVPKKETSKKKKGSESEIKTREAKNPESTKRKVEKKNVKSTQTVTEINPAKKEKGEPKTSKTSKTANAKVAKTPAKKRATILKRKSIGSIIKPPKMKPKANA